MGYARRVSSLGHFGMAQSTWALVDPWAALGGFTPPGLGAFSHALECSPGDAGTGDDTGPGDSMADPALQ